MARTYIPTTVLDVHKQVKFMARYQVPLRAAIVAVNPAYGVIFDELLAALLAFDALAGELYPLED